MINSKYRIAIPKTVDGNGISEAIYAEMEALGQRPYYFPLETEIPSQADVVLLFGPFGKFLHIPQAFAGLPRRKRPIFAYWNTEGLPDLRLPWPLVKSLSLARSLAGRMDSSPNPGLRRLAARPPLSTLENRLLRYRYLGDYFHAWSRGWLDVFYDISAVYADFFRRRGLPAGVAPFGSHAAWHADLNLKRDIDVLWMGKRGSRRRGEALDRLREELRRQGVEIYMIDNEERPFVYNEERTELINRAKITLNLLRTWYDENSLRICLAAPNRSLVISEPLLPHVPEYRPGLHYISTPLEKMAGSILYYLEHAAERQAIVDNAHRLLTETLTFRRSMRFLLEAIERVQPARTLGVPARGRDGHAAGEPAFRTTRRLDQARPK